MTSRTVSEVLALFPDQATQSIHPQAVRDLVDSVAAPLPVQGFGGTRVGTDEVALSKAGSTVTLAGTATPIWIPMQVRRDPNGWVNAGSFTSPYAGGTVPANSSVTLPQGIYHISWDTNISGDPGAGKTYAFFANWVDDPSSYDVAYGDPGFFFGPAFGANDSQGGGLGAVSQYVVGHGVFRQNAAMATAGVRLAFHAYQTKGSALTLNFSDVLIVKVA